MNHKKIGKFNNSVKTLKKCFEILNDENRLRILYLLKEHNELCVCEIYEALDLPQNLASYHLGKLKTACFVEAEKQGAKVIYRQGCKKLKDLESMISALISKK